MNSYTTERDFYEKSLKKLAPTAHWQRIEAYTGTGAPDVNMCYNGVEAWFETKIGKFNKKKGVISFYYMLGQAPWLTLRARSGGICFTAIHVPKLKKNYFIKGIFAKALVMTYGTSKIKGSVQIDVPEAILEDMLLQSQEDILKVFRCNPQ